MTDATNPHPPLPDRARLPLVFDRERLEADLALIGRPSWTPHFVPQDYEGRWEILPLRYPAGATHPILQAASPPRATSFVDGEMLARAPYVRDVLAAFRTALKSVRLMRLRPGSRIKEHRDHDLAAERGEARIHVPITTNPGVTFALNGIPVRMVPGEAWYLRLADPHAVTNAGETDRVHLVIDCVANEWLRSLIAARTDGGGR